MLPLRELQARFLRSIATTPERSDGHGFDPALLELVEGRGRLGSTYRLGVYTETYLARLLDVLRDDFPRVDAVLGAARFTALAGAHLARPPSTDPSVSWVADDPKAAATTVRPAATVLRVWREAFAVYQTPVDAVEHVALRQLLAGAPFGVMCDRLEAVLPPPAVAREAGALILRWVEDQI